MREHVITGKTENSDIHILSFTTGEFKDIRFAFNTVAFDDTLDELVVKFNYTVYDDPNGVLNETNEKQFQTELGDFVVEILQFGLEKKKLGYIELDTVKGDTLDNRANDLIESDSQRGVLPQDDPLP